LTGYFDRRDKELEYMDALLDLYMKRFKDIQDEVEEMEKRLGWTKAFDKRMFQVYFTAKIELDIMAKKMKEVTDQMSKFDKDPRK